jgi:hypothetical protein
MLETLQKLKATNNPEKVNEHAGKCRAYKMIIKEKIKIHPERKQLNYLSQTSHTKQSRNYNTGHEK